MEYSSAGLQTAIKDANAFHPLRMTLNRSTTYTRKNLRVMPVSQRKSPNEQYTQKVHSEHTRNTGLVA